MYGVEIGKWDVPSSSNPSAPPHRVKRWRGGDYEFSCSCQGWRFKKKGQERSCAHIMTIKMLLSERQVKNQLETPVETGFPPTPAVAGGRRRFSLED